MSTSPHNDDTTPPARPKPPRRLVDAIVALSVASNWGEARAEWGLDYVYLTEVPGVCLCGHPITEHCLLVNHLNGNQVVVGNICVEQFLDLPSDKLFAALRRISADPSASLNAEVIGHAYSKGYIDEWQRSFYLDVIGNASCHLNSARRGVRSTSGCRPLSGGRRWPMPVSARRQPSPICEANDNPQLRVAALIAVSMSATCPSPSPEMNTQEIQAVGVHHCADLGQAGRDGQAGQDSKGAQPTPRDGPLAAVEDYLTAYMVVPDRLALVIAAWVLTAWLADAWDHFAHLAITSPEKALR